MLAETSCSAEERGYYVIGEMWLDIETMMRSMVYEVTGGGGVCV